MSARILSGKEFAAKFKEDAAKRARALEAQYGVTPGGYRLDHVGQENLP